jgi:hypothetical protein
MACQQHGHGKQEAPEGSQGCRHVVGSKKARIVGKSGLSASSFTAIFSPVPAR